MRSTLQRAIDTYGTTNQILMAVEEMAELTTELSHHLRGRDNRDMVLEEIADAMIMLNQLQIIFGEEDIQTWIKVKVERLRLNILQEWKGECFETTKETEGKH